MFCFMNMTLANPLEIITLQKAQLAEMSSLYENAQRQIEQLKHQIELLTRRLYGSRSERYEADQFFMDDLLRATQNAAVAEEQPKIEVKATERRKARPHGRTAIPEHLKRVEILLDLPDEKKIDPATGEKLMKLRDEVSEKIAWDPGSWYVKRFVRPLYVKADRQSEAAGVFSTAMPDSPIDKCKADNSVLALVAVKKWADHLPVYRQLEIFRREGIKIASSTLESWSIDPLLACEPLYEALKKSVLSAPVVATDDTPVNMQVPGLGKTRSARFWVYVAGAGPPQRFFDFSEDRRKEHPAAILEYYRGFLQADAYGGYDELFKLNRYIIEVGCWAHARRKFDEAKTSAPEESTEMLGRIRLLYDIERKIKDATPDEKLAVRQAESSILLAALFQRAAEMTRNALPSSPLGKALTYALNQREALLCYVTDGRLRIDNNLAENAIRPLALGRKNWLFAGSARGGKACAIALSLIQSARALDINCYDYMLDVYNRIMSHPVSKLDELLPANWKAARLKDNG